MPRATLLLRCFAISLCLGLPVAGQGIDADFKPELAGVELTSREVRPGDHFGMTVKLRNASRKAARGDYWLFVHSEAGKGCRFLPYDPHEIEAFKRTICESNRTASQPNSGKQP